MAIPPRRPIPGAPPRAGARPRPGAAAPRGRAPAPKKSPVVPLVLAGGALVVGVALFFVMKGGSGGTEKDGKTANAAGTSASPAPTGPSSPAAPSPDGGGTAVAAAPAATPAPAPPRPKLELAAAVAKLAEVKTAKEAVELGDVVLSDTNDLEIAEKCWRKALELEPGDVSAKARLDVKPFRPERDLPGLDDVTGTPQTWMLAEFLALSNKELSKGERERAVARWTGQRKVIEARMAEADGDPFLTKIDTTRNQIARLPFFENFEYDVVESTRPYALFVELKGETLAERDERREQVETAYQPFLAAYDRSIHDYLVKLSPAPPKEDPTLIVFLLRDRASYDRFFVEFEKSAAPPGIRAHYNPVEKFAYTYSPELKDVKSPDFAEGTQVLLHELTHDWVDHLATLDGPEVPEVRRNYDGNLVQTHWLSEGIAEFMSCHFLDEGGIRFQPWKSMRLAEVGQRPPGLRIPLERGFRIGRHGGLDAEARMAAQSQSAVDPGRAAIIMMSGFYADMSLFIFWLNYGEGGKHRRAFQDYVRKELSGAGGSEVAEKVFADVLARTDLEATIDAFQKDVTSKKVSFKDEDLKVEK
jgi:hypothetical protein